MMELTIHTYGYRDALYYVLNGIAMFRNSGLYEILVYSATLLTGAFYGLRLVASTNYGNMMFYFRKTIGMLIFANLVLLPTTEMILRDHVGKTIDKIDNIPIAFAIPIGIIENFGQVITLGFEQVFAPIETAVNPSNPVFSYYNYGMLFGARLKKEVSQVRIKDPEFISNMRSFTKQCIALPAAKGYQFTLQELVSTKDIWQLVKSKAGTLSRTSMIVGSEHITMNCKDAAEYFEYYWEGEHNRIIGKFLKTDFGRARTSSNYGAPDSSLSKIFENNVKVLHQGTKSAKDILRQQMMINSLSEYRSGAYGVSRARMQQETNSMLSSDVASLYLPMLLAVSKCIIYAVFIFLVPMMIFGGGFSKYLSYLTIVASLQLWPAINAILNMIMGTYSNLKVGNGMLVSYSTMSSVSNHMDTIVTVAGSLQVAVPVIAYYMTNLGIGGLMHMASSMSNSMQSGTQGVASEIATGNRGFDNVSENNVSRNNSNANKHDHNTQYFNGVNSIHTDDGGIKRTNPDGSVVFSGGAGMTTSAGSVRFNMEDNLQNQLSQGAQQSDAIVDRDSRSYSDTKSNTMNKASDFVAQLAKREHEGESFNYDSMGEQGKSLRQAVDTTRSLHDKHGYGWNQAALMEVEAHARGSTPLTGLTGVDIGGGTRGSITAQNSSEQSVGNEHGVSRGNHTDQSYNNIVRAASNSNWAEENSIDTRLSDEIRASYGEERRLEQQLSKSIENSKNWHDAQTRFGTSGATMSRDMYDDVMKELVSNGQAKTHDEARNLIESGSPAVKKVWGNMVDRQLGSYMNNINKERGNIQGHAATRELDEFSQQHSSNIKKEVKPNSIEELQAAMDKYGFNPAKVEKGIDKTQASLKDKYFKVTAENDTQYKAVKKYNEMEQGDLQQRADQYEKDRIGNGDLAKGTAYILDKVTTGRAGKDIGNPTDNGQKYNDDTRHIPAKVLESTKVEQQSKLIDHSAFQKAQNKNVDE